VDEQAEAVAAALRAHGYTMSGVLALLGTDAYAALGRGEAVPARRVLAKLPAGPLAHLVRLFLLGEVVDARLASAALPLADAEAVGLVARDPDSGTVTASWHIQPYPTQRAGGLVVSDFPAGRRSGQRGLPLDHVTGVGGASVTLATITPRRQVSSTLDLGTGCGIQALLAADHSAVVVATDVSGRALLAAGLTAALSGRAFDLRRGPLFQPSAGEVFDLVVANPPFVISPQARHTYREAPLPADDLGRSVVSQTGQHLTPGGIAVVLANWLHIPGEPWQERVAGWAPDGCQVWAVEREYLSAGEYVELWLKDSAENGSARYEERYAQWYAYLDDLGAAGVGFGWFVVRRADPSWFVAEDLSDSDRLPDGEEVLAQLDRFTALQSWGAVRMLSSSPCWEDEVELHSSTDPKSGGQTGLLATGPWRPAQEVDPLVAELLELSGPLSARLDALEGVDQDEAMARALIGLRGLFGAGLIRMDG
jgi:methylase of polypeptide subunit release factors